METGSPRRFVAKAFADLGGDFRNRGKLPSDMPDGPSPT